MAWNKAILVTQGSQDKIETDLLDIFQKTKSGLCTDDALSISIWEDLTVGSWNDQVLIIDVLGRFVENDLFPRNEVSVKNKECRLFWISEGGIYRHYVNGEIVDELNSRDALLERMKTLEIIPEDEWGESLILQLFDYYTFGMKRKISDSDFWNMSFDQYSLI